MKYAGEMTQIDSQKDKVIPDQTYGNYNDSELIIGLVGALGTDLKSIREMVKDRLQAYDYETEIISISGNVISE